MLRITLIRPATLLERSQLVLPSRSNSLFSLSSKILQFLSLINALTRLDGGLYQARTINDLLFGGSVSIHFQLYRTSNRTINVVKCICHLRLDSCVVTHARPSLFLMYNICVLFCS